MLIGTRRIRNCINVQAMQEKSCMQQVTAPSRLNEYAKFNPYWPVVIFRMLHADVLV
jgi:hypothetical protein